MSASVHSLPPGTLLDTYVIEATLGGGGFSIVYLATSVEGERRVAIKEYMPTKLARREADQNVVPVDEESTDTFNRGLQLFLLEARALATLKHPNIVNVTSFFRAFGTVYMVMDYEHGKNLQDYVKNRRGNMSEMFMYTIFPPLLDGLRLIHSCGYLHLDIKPPNVHLRPGGKPLLLDFGAVHRAHETRQFQPGRVVTPGFSPIEQYESRGYVGPWTDIYAIGATMRTCLEGRAPRPAVERRERDTMKPAAVAFRRRYPAALLEAIDWAMEVDPLLRPQSVDELLQALEPPADTDAPEPPEEGSMFERLAGSLPWTKG
jgi:serine/threonine protein kinase